MRPSPILLAPLLLGALHAPAASGAPAPAPYDDEPLEALATPAPPASTDPAEPDLDADTLGPRFTRLATWDDDAALSAPPPPVPLAADPPSDEKTPRPTAAEWRDAPAVLPARSAPGCKAQRVREWLRIACPIEGELAAMDLLAGPREGVAFAPGLARNGVHAVVFPMRRGDRRVFEVVRVASASKYTLDYDVAFTISEDWLADAPAPTVVVD